MIISLERITKHYSGETVLKNIVLTIEDSDRIGLTGINGSGKTTLLRIISGFENPDSIPDPHSPVIHKVKDKNIGYLAQNSGLDKAGTVYGEMRAVFSPLDEAAKRMRSIEAGGMQENDLEEYSHLSAFFEANDGYLIDVKINKILGGLSFSPALYAQVTETLSGGEKTRLALAKLLLEEPHLLILDEPTNHLDFNTLIWLEDYLSQYRGALLIVSHDRYFLDRLCTSMCEIERGFLRRFKGNYSSFAAQKTALVERQLKEYSAQQQEIAKLEDYVARNIVRASTSNMAKSRVKRLEAMERINKPVTGEKTAKIKFEYDITPPLDILKVRGIDVSVPCEKSGHRLTLVSSVTFDIRRGDRVGVIGANGAGKSTLLKVIQRLMPIQKGEVQWADNVKISYFDQENARLDPNDTVINAIHGRFISMKEGEIRTLLGGVRLTGDDVFKRVSSLSGGERAKLCFALMMLERANVLILDEPTNHLDIATREVIEAALAGFTGTMLFVSHDRYLLSKLATRILEISADTAHYYAGGFDEYTQAKREAEKPENLDKPALSPAYRSKQQRADDAKRRTRIRELEQEVEHLDSEIARLENELALPEVYSDYVLLGEKHGELEAVKQRLNEASDEWLTLT